jgi:hypothetical protein
MTDQALSLICDQSWCSAPVEDAGRRMPKSEVRRRQLRGFTAAEIEGDGSIVVTWRRCAQGHWQKRR